ncbi:ABC transporter permease [Angustibacter aerolatus]
MGLAARLRAVVETRKILWLLVRRDLKVRYASSALGYVWTVLDPLLMTLIYFFVFSVIFKRGQNSPESPYIVFLAFGQLAWGWFSGAVNDSCRALVSEKKLVRSTRLPREIWVLKVVGSKGIEYVLSLPVIVLFLVTSQTAPSWRHLLFFPLGLLIQSVLLVGLGLMLSAVTVLVTDLARVVRIVLRMLFYATPILYSIQSLDGRPNLQRLFDLNPMTGILDLYRASVYPDQMAGAGTVALSAGISVAILFLGSWVFRRLESPVLKEL